MRRKHLARSAIYAIGLAVFLSFSFVPEVSAFSAPDLLTVQVKPTAITGESIDQVVSRLAEYEIPVGIELGDEKLTPRREITLNLPQTTLKDFLDSVIAEDPGTLGS